ncbi:hypothetical protein VFPPC_17114 [Pochonia chlamydosporia 170]|uniref:Uncharacterized protein n=1 Tax=Pochonia chlamydosporia 170 TaxID=1380566 RepID=A0A179EWY5_METCM|nr:hypothetical protein VFPPC_17114 [Pochonia chlamydosporia 170]OAQ57697.1 hypothetical protein VFPPC_17114 [Pochonia chlamydosporia 170]
MTHRTYITPRAGMDNTASAAVDRKLNIVEPLFILGHISQALTQHIITYVGIASFVAIALAKCATAGFLLKTLHSADRSLQRLAAMESGNLYRYLMRSTEFRLITLALVGIERATDTNLGTDHSLTTYRNIVAVQGVLTVWG